MQYKKLLSKVVSSISILTKIVLNFTVDTTYSFGQNGGVIWYEWKEVHPSPRSNDLDVGFSTVQSDALLVKVVGSKINGVQNFLELAIVRCLLVVIFVMFIL